MVNKYNIETFEIKARTIHGDKYNYEKFVYVNYITKGIIICPIHGEFLQRPADHLSGRGCLKCGIESAKKKLSFSLEEFAKKGTEKHNGKYTYEEAIYVNFGIKLKITCPLHGVFEQAPSHHLGGQGCPTCGNCPKNKKINTKRKKIIDLGKISVRGIDDVIKYGNIIHKDKFNYSNADYINTSTKIKIICPIHGEFLQTPHHHIYRKQGCGKCRGQKIREIFSFTTEELIERFRKQHGDKYDYSLINEINNLHIKVNIICPKHGIFIQCANSHLRGANCWRCCDNNTSSAGSKWLNSLDIKNMEREFPIEVGGHRYLVDGFDRKTNTVYEYNGRFWHGHPDYYNPNDINPKTGTTFGELYKATLEKERILKEAGYKVITKWGK